MNARRRRRQRRRLQLSHDPDQTIIVPVDRRSAARQQRRGKQKRAGGAGKKSYRALFVFNSSSTHIVDDWESEQRIDSRFGSLTNSAWRHMAGREECELQAGRRWARHARQQRASVAFFAIV